MEELLLLLGMTVLSEQLRESEIKLRIASCDGRRLHQVRINELILTNENSCSRRCCCLASCWLLVNFSLLQKLRFLLSSSGRWLVENRHLRRSSLFGFAVCTVIIRGFLDFHQRRGKGRDRLRFLAPERTEGEDKGPEGVEVCEFGLSVSMESMFE